jgi:hypothetical protein
MKRLYALLAVVGLVVPFVFFGRFLVAEGLNLSAFFRQLTATPISIFFALDLVIATVVFWVFAYRETRDRPIPFWWITVVASILIGLSFALPLFLYLREGARERRAKTGSVI